MRTCQTARRPLRHCSWKSGFVVLQYIRVQRLQIRRQSPVGLVLQMVATAQPEELVGVRSDRHTTSLPAKAVKRGLVSQRGAPFNTTMPTRISAPAILLAVPGHARSLAAGS
jgi:hypothetical protein